MHSNSTMNIRNNNYPNQEYNNKLALECSYLINEIKRKNTSLLLPIYITDKKIYLKDKLLSNKKSHTYLKRKNSIKKLMTRNIHNNILSKNISGENIRIRKHPIIQKDNIYNKVPLTSLYNLPKIRCKDKIRRIKSVIINNNNNINDNPTTQTDNTSGVKKDNKKSNDFLGIENIMRDKFYADTENKLKNKIKTKYFRNDGTIKKEIIFMKKFGIFWKGFIQYCSPIINLKKYKIDYKNKENNINIIDGYINKDKDNQNNNSSKKNKALSLPKIDTSKFKLY